jgi:hypothetical protein
LDNHPSPLKSRLLSLSMILLVLGIYSYPAIKTTIATGLRALPPINAPDLSLYMNISGIKATSSAEVLDPYYGLAVPVARMGYLKFRLAFLTFGELTSLLHGNLWWTLFLWNFFWWGLLCVLAVWFFQQFFPDRSSQVVLAGLTFLMLFNFGIVPGELAAWSHLPSLNGFRTLQLPYIRPFFPQIPIPFLLLYLGLQIKAIRKGTWWLWTAMGVTQLVAFAIFPYTTLMMAGITAAGVVGQLLSHGSRARWGWVSIYAIACAAVDLLFFFHGDAVARTGAPGQYSLIHLQLSLLPRRVGGMWLLLAALTALVLVVRDSAPEVRWSLAGLGLTNLFLLSGDAFFSETALQVSHHGGYFVQLTAAVLVVFLVSAAFRYLNAKNSAWRFALGSITALLVLNGMLIARATYWASLPTNQEVAELARFLQSDPPQANDLVIAHSLFVDDDCAWVPLISRSHVLFCRNAQVLLTPEQNQQIQRFRQALYLYFTGKDNLRVRKMLDDPKAETELTRLTFLGQVTTDMAERNKGTNAVRTELLPLLTRVEQNDPSMRSFFVQYRRVVVVDNIDKPNFAVSRLAEYLKIENQQTIGDLRILYCSPQS